MRVCLALTLSLSVTLLKAQIIINEFSSSNEGYVKDENGDSPDWIELYNAGGTAIDLKGWGLTDDSLQPFKWIFPQRIISPGEFMLVFASGKDRSAGQYLHTNFKLEKAEEPLLLFNPSGTIADGYPCLCIPANYSYGDHPDASGESFHFKAPSPGFSNNSSAYVQLPDIKDSISFSHPGGLYENDITLSLSVSNSASEIRYTTDGSTPGIQSALYVSAFSITRSSAAQDGISYIPTSPEWETPRGEVFKGTVVRAAAYASGCKVSKVYTHTYLVDPMIFSRYRFPLVSISTDKNNFFSEHTGIYVEGHYGLGNENYYNKGEDWERPVHFELFGTDGKLLLQQDAGARIHGRASRARPQKSLRLYAKNKYGDEDFDHRFFPGKEIDSFRRILLRTTNVHESTTLFKDELAAEVIRKMNIDYQDYLPVIVFINGEYWGIHNLRERLDKYYIQNNHLVSSDSIDLLGLSLDGNEEMEGDANRYNALMSFIATHDMANEVYFQEVEKQIDIDNYIDVHIAHLYFANYDWPRNNVRYWSERSEKGKWRWMFFDCDFCMNNIYYNHIVNYINGEVRFEDATWLVRQLMKNERFRKQFLQRFMHHLNTTFEPQQMITTIREFREMYAPMVNEHINRWGMPESYAAWESNVNDLENFALKRPLEMVNQLTELYGNPYKVYPNPASDKVHIDMFNEDDIALQVKLFNVQGQEVIARAFGNAGELEDGTIDVSSLSPGLYVLRIQYGNLIFSDKIVVQ